MFSTTGAFKKIACPGGSGCQLLNCIFDHEDMFKAKREKSPVNSRSHLRNASVSPPSKRRKLSVDESVKINGLLSPEIRRNTYLEISSASEPAVAVPQPQQSSSISHSTENRKKLQKATLNDDLPPAKISEENGSVVPVSKEVSRAIDKVVKSLVQEIEPPPIVRRQPETPTLNLSNTETPENIVLRPRDIPRQPAPFSKRLDFLKKLHKVIDLTNTRLAKALNGQSELRMTAQETILQALEDEEAAARKSSSAETYQQAISNTMVKFNKMIPSTWTEFMAQSWRKPAVISTSADKRKVVTGLTPAQEVAFIHRLVTPITGLEKYGYVTNLPSQEAVMEAIEVVKSTGNYEVCDRCNTRFQVFPGRNETGDLVSGGLCRYHWARSTYRKGSQENTYPCCGLATHIGGCVVAKSHVFKVSDKNRLASQLQFARTPDHNDGKTRGPVTYDCEMVYTTLGMELARLTAMSWPDKKLLLDVLVRPYGEILDFNTRFSGITVEMYNHAKEYESAQATTSTDDVLSEDREITEEPLRRVSSPAAARSLLFDLLNPDTPLIGHAIDNDLNTCRIVHPTIVDTVLLYPHPRGLPIRYRLKELAARYLQRDIQTGGAAGHDSKEDSEATGDLVLEKIRDEWKKMKGAGWSWNGNELVSPLKRAGMGSTSTTSKV